MKFRTWVLEFNHGEGWCANSIWDTRKEAEETARVERKYAREYHTDWRWRVREYVPKEEA